MLGPAAILEPGLLYKLAEKAMPHFKAGKDILNRLNLNAPDAKTNDSLNAT